MKIIFNLIFLIMPFVSFANDDVRKYYDLINIAELNIADNKPQQALENYQLAFQIKPPFCIDIYNATVCAISLNKNEVAITLCNMLAQKGVGAPFLEKKIIFNKLHQHAKWKTLLKFAIKCKDSNARNTENYNLFFSDLAESDQKFNKIYTKMKEGDTLKNYEWAQNFQDSLSNQLLNFFEKNNIMSENQLGVLIKNDTVLSTFFKYNIIIIHAMQLGSFDNRLRFWKLIKDNIDNGILDNRFLYSIDVMGGFFGFTLPIEGNRNWRIFDCKIYENNSPDWEKARNEKLRKDFYFSNYKDLLHKSLFKLYNKETPYVIGTKINVGSLELKKFLVEETNSFKETNLSIKDCK